MFDDAYYKEIRPKEAKNRNEVMQLRWNEQVHSLYIESPMTKEAIIQQGFTDEYFSNAFKELEKAKDSEVSEKIQRMRVEYYSQRLAKAIRDVNERRREIKNKLFNPIEKKTQQDNFMNNALIQQRQRNHSSHQIRNGNQLETEEPDSNDHLSRTGNNESSKSHRAKNESGNVKRIIQYLKSSHHNSDLISPNQLLKGKGDCDDILEHEVKRFNKKKELEQKKASKELNVLVREIKKEQNEKEKLRRKVMKEIKAENDQKNRREERERELEFQQEQLKEREAAQQVARREWSQDIKNKMELIRKKQQQDEQSAALKRQERTKMSFDKLSKREDSIQEERQNIKHLTFKDEFLASKMGLIEHEKVEESGEKKLQLEMKMRKEREVQSLKKQLDEERNEANLQLYVLKMKANCETAAKHVKSMLAEESERKQRLEDLQEVHTERQKLLTKQRKEFLEKQSQKARTLNKLLEDKRRADEELLEEKKEKAYLRHLEVKENEAIQKRKRFISLDRYLQKEKNRHDQIVHIRESKSSRLIQELRKENEYHIKLESQRIQQNMGVVAYKLLEEKKMMRKKEDEKVFQILKKTLPDSQLDKSLSKTKIIDSSHPQENLSLSTKILKDTQQPPLESPQNTHKNNS